MRRLRPTSLDRSNLTEFLLRRVRRARNQQRIALSEPAEFYLVQLLEAFARPPRGWLDRPLAIEYLESLHETPRHRFHKLKRVGDTSLFLSGLFMEYLEHRIVSADYYIALGRSAYGHLAGTGSAASAWAGPTELFSELAHRFADLVRVLCEMSDRDFFRTSPELARVYRRWFYTRHPPDAAALIRRGLIPFAPPTTHRH